MRLSRGHDGRPAAVVEDIVDKLRRPSSRAHFQKEARQAAHHLIQETVSGYLESNISPVLAHIEQVDGADRSVKFTFWIGGEGGEIMLTGQQFRCCTHAFHIEGPPLLQAIEPLRGRNNGSVVDKIAVLVFVLLLAFD